MITQIAFFKCDVQITLATTDTKDAIRQMQFWNSIPDQCPVCQSSLVFHHYTAQSFDFWGMRCTNPEERHQLNFHEYKEGKGFFLKDRERIDPALWTKWSPGSNREEEEERQPAPSVSTTTAKPAASKPAVSKPATTAAEPAQETETDLQRIAESIKGTAKREQIDGQSCIVVGAFVIRLVDGKPVCDCRKFINQVAKSPDFACEHIRAAKLYIVEQSK